MSNQRTGLYEGIFLFPQSATTNLQDAIDHVKDILDKCDADIINFRKWDERRLAYEIDNNKRGVYFLVYFKAPTSALSDIERRCNQSEQLLRIMITKADQLPIEIIEANEGAEELATEITLRGEKTVQVGEAVGSTVARKEDKIVKEAPTPKSKAKSAKKAKKEPEVEAEANPEEEVQAETTQEVVAEETEIVVEETETVAKETETVAKETEEVTEA